MAEQAEVEQTGTYVEEDSASALFNNALFIEKRLFGLDLFLDEEETRDDFPYDFRKRVDEYQSYLSKLLGDMVDIGKNPGEIYTLDGKKLTRKTRNFMKYVEDLVLDLKEYREMRTHWDDVLNYKIKELEEVLPYVEREISLTYEIEKKPTLHTKRKNVKEKEAVVTTIAAIFMAAMFIFTMKSAVIMNTISSIGITATGFAVAPTGGFSGVNFELFYLLTSSMIVSIYILGRVMKKW